MEDMRLVITRQAHLAGLDDEFIPITIARAESGLDPSLQKDGGYGLFQLHRGGLAQSTLTDEELLDPHVNASLAIRGMLGNYRGGKAKGLSGIQLVQYVAYYSGWPTLQGPEYVAEHFPDYGKKLAAAYLEERQAEEADKGNVVTHPAPPMPDILKEPDSGLVKPDTNLPKPENNLPNPAPPIAEEPQQVQPEVTPEAPQPETTVQEETKQDESVNNVVDNVDKTDYADLSLHTGVPVDILKGYANRGGSIMAIPHVYRVKAGETLADICQREGADYVTVLEVNRIDPQHMYTGQVIYL